MRLHALVLGFMLLAAPGFAADVDGKWAGAVESPMGEFPMVFTFKADGAALTGTMQGMDGMDTPIKDGKIDGANISYTVTLDFGGMAFDLSFTGVVTASEIKLSGDAGGMPFEVVVKKAP